MPSMPQGGQTPLPTVDRRLRVRRPAPSLLYIDLGENNGGIVLNIGEGGLAVTSAAPLYAEGLARMRFQLPGSSARLEVSGEIAWINQSRREAGLRFVDLSEDIRNRIRGAVSVEKSPGQTDWESGSLSEEKAQSAGLSATVKGASASFAGTDQAHKKVQGSMSGTGTDTRPRGQEGFVASHAERHEPVVPDKRPFARETMQRSDRRVRVRRSAPSLVYLDLGENNGGIVLNMSEGGLAVTSAAPLYAEGLARMRFQLPGSSARLEASGEIAWINQSRREAGLRFVDLSEDVCNQIRAWILSAAPSIKLQSEGPEPRERVWRRLEMPTIRVPDSISVQPASPDRAAPEPAQVPTPTLEAAHTLLGDGTSVGARSSGVSRPHLSKPMEYRLGLDAGQGPRKALGARRTSWIVAVVFVLGASYLLGWFVGGPESRIFRRSQKTELNTEEPASVAESAPASSVASVPGPSLEDSPANQDEPKPLSLTRTEPAPVVRETNMVGSSVEPARPKARVSESGSASPVRNAPTPEAKNGPSPGTGSVTQQSHEISVTTPQSPIVSQPEGARVAGTAGQGSPPPPKPAEIPEVQTTSVSVSFGLYPSIRVSAALKSQMSRQSTTLQIGQLLSRVDPVYPEDAKMQHVEGTVKLHVIIGPDGLIESVEPRSGPASLIPAAVNAVRQWQYTVSSVGGQPVEAEQDITVTFQLLKQAAHPN